MELMEEYIFIEDGGVEWKKVGLLVISGDVELNKVELVIASGLMELKEVGLFLISADVELMEVELVGIEEIVDIMEEVLVVTGGRMEFMKVELVGRGVALTGVTEVEAIMVDKVKWVELLLKACSGEVEVVITGDDGKVTKEGPDVTLLEFLGVVSPPFGDKVVCFWTGDTAGRLNWRLSEARRSEELGLEDR